VHCLQVQFNGLTPLGTNLNSKVIQPFLASGVNGRNLAKPILVRFTLGTASAGFLMLTCLSHQPTSAALLADHMLHRVASMHIALR